MSTPQIEIEHISFHYDRLPVLNNITYTVNEGDFLGITGPNGGGKTTLLRIILGLQSVSQGMVRFYKNSNRIQSPRIGYLPQKNVIDYRFPISVHEVVGSGLLREKRRWKDFSPEQKNAIEKTIDRMGLSDMTDRPIGNLSGGQQQRALFGRALVSKPDILMLDEPTSYIDKNFEDKMKEILKEANRTATILFVSHDTESITEMTNHVIKINETLEILK